MIGRPSRPLLLAAVILVAVIGGAVALAAPSAALACGGGPSAVNVYVECTPSGGGSKPTSAPPSKPTSKPTNGRQTNPVANSGASSSPQHPVSHRAAGPLAGAGRDKALLSSLVKSPGLGPPGLLHSNGSEPARPSILGSAFDFGSGPTALLIVLAGTAVLLLGTSGLRGWRRWRARA